MLGKSLQPKTSTKTPAPFDLSHDLKNESLVYLIPVKFEEHKIWIPVNDEEQNGKSYGPSLPSTNQLKTTTNSTLHEESKDKHKFKVLFQ